MKLALKTIGISILSISMLISFGLTSNQAFAGGVSPPTECEDCDELERLFEQEGCIINTGAGSQSISPTCDAIIEFLQTCRADFCRAIGGNLIQMETTSVLAAGAQYTAAWMIPVIVSAIGIGIVIARKF